MKVRFLHLLMGIAVGVLVGCQSMKHNEAYFVLFSNEYAIGRAAPVIHIDRRVFQYVRETGERENPEARIYVQGDLDGDKVEDTALLTMFDLALSNNQVLFVCLSSRPKHVMLRKVGGKGYRDANILKIKDGRIVIEGKRYASDDAMCCPSIPFQATFTIQADTISNGATTQHLHAQTKNSSSSLNFP